MTRLQQWLKYGLLFAIPYIVLVSGIINTPLINKWKIEIILLPVFLAFIFGVYSASTVIYRAASIKDCPEAAKELQDQIKEARKDLIAKGFKFRD